MIIVDETDPVGENLLSFPSRDVTIKRGTDAKEFYDLHTEIGRGKFGTVYKCKEKSSGLQLAAKFVPIPKRDDRRNVEREVEIMNSLQHPLIIQLYDAYEFQKMMCVVLELIEGGELFDRVIDDDFVLTEKACIIFIRQVCEAMEFIHRNNILHLDLKPENILCLTRQGNRVKVIDFGLARKYDPEKKLQVLFGTPEFVAPEVVNFDLISFGTDMWSVGVICYVLLSGLSPFMGETDISTMANVTIAKYDFDDEVFTSVSKESLDFISKLLVKDISFRMTASECLEHIWLKRRLKPQVAPKPASIPPTKYRNTVHSQPQTDELGRTKENLKNFIERWEEHPNSPYVLDSESNNISPVATDNVSCSSSRVFSPSPCGSLSSSPDIPATIATENVDNELDKFKSRPKSELFQDIADIKPNKNFKEYLQTFERRHSDSNCLLNRSTSFEMINLADEIKKLSDRLLMLSSINTTSPIVTNGDINTPDLDRSEPKHSTSKKSEIKQKKSSKTTITGDKKNDSSNVTTLKKTKLTENFNRSVSVSEFSSKFSKKSFLDKSSIFNKTITSNNDNRSSVKNSTMVSALNERLKALDSTPSISKKLETTKPLNSENKARTNKVKNLTNGTARTLSSSNSSSIIDNHTTNVTGHNTTINSDATVGNTALNTKTTKTVPWPVSTKRTKFRITQLSRDVPIDSPDRHQTVFLDEAANSTKDRLLHLLEKYNQKESKPYLRHQSISLEYGMSDNLEYRSMNSLNAFFQRHANEGTAVKQIQQKIESNHKV